ncbi:MAG: hypothetical protein HY053_06025 [Proteobacteria bacterium]|nr:hypothetical protein [Pseudomonadota bacterium]
MNPGFKKPLEEFLREGDEDYIGLWQIIGRVSTVLNLDERKLTISDTDKLWRGIQEFITLMLNNGFEAVDLAPEGKCKAWPDQNPAAVIAEIKKLWIERKGDVGSDIWFHKLPTA